MKALAVISLAFAFACGPKSKPVEGGGGGGGGGDPAPKGSGGGSAEECPKEECGPKMGMPNRKCPDGTIAGPTDRCLRHADGKCGWEVIQCPSGGTAQAGNPCKPTGCSGTLCSDQDMVSTCIYLPEYDCYKGARCEPQSDGKCGWTQTNELTSCIATKKKK
jgi:hypothetical protein